MKIPMTVKKTAVAAVGVVFAVFSFELTADDIPASAYVQDGLVAQWDGIENAGYGASHDAAATSWIDLRSGLAFDLSGSDAVEATAVKLANVSHASTGSIPGQDVFWKLPYVTVEASAGQIGYTAKKRNAVVNVHKRAIIQFDTNFEPEGGSCFDVSCPFDTAESTRMNNRNVICADRHEVTNRHTYATAAGLTRTQIPYFDGVRRELGSNLNSDDGAGSKAVSDGRIYLGNTTSSIRYNAIRVYNRRMSDSELFINAALDRMRFDGVAPGDIAWPAHLRFQNNRVESRLTLNVNDAEGGTVNFLYGPPASEVTSDWRDVNGGAYTVIAVASPGYRFAGWQGVLGDADSRTDVISVKPSTAGTLTAVFLPETSGCWVYSDPCAGEVNGIVSNVCNGCTFKATRSGTNLTLTGWVYAGEDGIADFWRLRKFSYDLTTEYEVTALGANFCQDNTGLREFYPPDAVTSFPNYGMYGCTALGVVRFPPKLTTLVNRAFQNCSAISNVVCDQFLPPTVTSVGTAAFKFCQKISQPLILNNPGLTSLGTAENFDRMQMLPSVDLTGSGVTAITAGSIFYNGYAISNFTFNASFASINNCTPFTNCSGLRRLRFRGNPPEILLKNPISGTVPTYLAYYAPKWNTEWESYVAAQENCTTGTITLAQSRTFATGHAGEPMPLCTISLGKLSTTAPFTWWYPDAPPFYRDVAYFDVIGYDRQHAIDGGASGEGIAATVSAGDRELFDGTTYTLFNHAQTNYLWTCADGHEATVEIPASATTARSLKFTGYRLHQLCLGDMPNGRAPTAWTLYGKTDSAGEWQVIHSYDMSTGDAKWAYFSYGEYSETVPSREECALTFMVPAAVQKQYVAFKFTPSNSYNRANSVDDATPFGLTELELLGQMLTPDPEVESFAVGAAHWSSIDFTANVGGLGAGSTGGKAWVEVAYDGEFTSLVATSATNDVTAGSDQLYAVGGLEGASEYHARLVVSNDLGLVTRSTLTGTAATLPEPWRCAPPVCDLTDPDNVAVSFSVDELYLAGPVQVSVYAADSPGGEFRLLKGPIDVSTTGGVPFELSGFTTDAPTAVVKVTISGGGVNRSYVSGVRSFWLADADSSPTQISNLVSGVTFAVTSAGGTNLTLKTLLDDRGETVFDFTVPIVSGNDQPMALASVGTVFQLSQTLEEVYLPGYMTAIPANAFNACGHLRKVRLPAGLKTIGDQGFADCPLLEDVAPLLPTGLTSCGARAFQNDYRISRLVIPASLNTFGEYAFYECHSLGEIEFEMPRPNAFTFSTSACWGCNTLTNVLPKAFPAETQIGTRPFKGCPLKGRVAFESVGNTSIGNESFVNCAWITEFDFSACGSVSFGGGQPLTCSRLERIVFPAGGIGFSGDGVIVVGNALKEVVFLGPPPEPVVNPFTTTSAYRFEVPGTGPHAAAWREYFAAHPEWLRPLTKQERDAFKTNFPGYRPIPRQMLNLGGVTGYHYLTGLPAVGFIMFVR